MSESVAVSDDLRAMLRDIQTQLAHLAQRVSGLEELASIGGAESASSVMMQELKAPSVEAQTVTPFAAVEGGISEEELLAVSTAIAVWLGVHAHIRQIRLIRTGAWAQQGRVTIQASHRLNH